MPIIKIPKYIITTLFLFFFITRYVNAQTELEINAPELPTEPNGNTYYISNAHNDFPEVVTKKIDNTCNEDVANTITALIKGLPENSILVIEEGCYLINNFTNVATGTAGSILIQNKNNLKITGVKENLLDENGNPILNKNKQPDITIKTIFKVTQHVPLNGCNINANLYSPRRHVLIHNSSNIIIENIRVESFNTTPDQREGFGAYIACREFEHGFTVSQNSTNILLKNLQSYGTWGDGVYIATTSTPSNITLQNIKIEKNGRQGVAISRGDTILADNIEILSSRRAGFDLEPVAKWPVKNVEIKNSYIRLYHVAFAAGGDGEVSNIYINNNTVEFAGAGGFFHIAGRPDYPRRNWIIKNNKAINGGGAGKATGVENLEVTGNTFLIGPTKDYNPSAQPRWGIDLLNTYGNVVISNNFFNYACIPFKNASVEVINQNNTGVKYNLYDSSVNRYYTKYQYGPNSWDAYKVYDCFTKGDINMDNSVNLLDINYGIEYIFNYNRVIPINNNLNNDSTFDLLDILELIKIVFL